MVQASVYMLATRVMSHQLSILKEKPASLMTIALETSDGSHVAFQGKEMGPPAH